ncbi:MAG: amidophosphoribosyltransferase [Clostridia bacterium]|nr:amidophosphoribosyltransferase [Clostridia bacterium]
MGGLFGVASKVDCALDLFFGIDYHSHLGTRRGGMAVYNAAKGYNRVIHNISNTPFRTKFDDDLDHLHGNFGIGCISDNDPQPLLMRSHLGTYAIATVGKINNSDELVKECFEEGHMHFFEMTSGAINSTELVAALINKKESFVEGIKYVHEKVDGSMSILILTSNGIIAARDKLGRTPLVIGKKDNARCVSFEDFAYANLGYTTEKELGPAEIVKFDTDKIEILAEAGKEMKMCSFLWVYYGYPTASYEGVNVENMRYECGKRMAQRDNIEADIAAGVPDSGLPAAIGYSNEAHVPFSRPFIKYTPTWPRSFMPQSQAQREHIAKMKLIAVRDLIKDKRMVLVDDSIVRGTQLGDTTQYLYESGAKEVHIRPACPPIMFGCKYLDFSRSTSELDLIARRVIRDREGDNVSRELLLDYCNPDSQNYKEMVEEIRKRLNFTSLAFSRLDDTLDSIGIDHCKLCTYCWNGEE